MDLGPAARRTYWRRMVRGAQVDARGSAREAESPSLD